MSVAIGKIEGVDSVKVSLNEGFADIRLKPGNTVDPERIRKVVRDNGFTPKAAEVRVAGRTIEQDGKPALSVTGLGLVYVLAEHPDAPGKLAELETAGSGAEVAVAGRLPESDVAPAEGVRRVLQLYELAAANR